MDESCPISLQNYPVEGIYVILDTVIPGTENGKDYVVSMSYLLTNYLFGLFPVYLPLETFGEKRHACSNYEDIYIHNPSTPSHHVFMHRFINTHIYFYNVNNPTKKMWFPLSSDGSRRLPRTSDREYLMTVLKPRERISMSLVWSFLTSTVGVSADLKNSLFPTQSLNK